MTNEEQAKCPVCDGQGIIEDRLTDAGRDIVCHKCEGTGLITNAAPDEDKNRVRVQRACSALGDDVAMRYAHNLVVLLLSALEALDAPKETIASITEHGDLEHVQWWLDERKAQNARIRDGAPPTPEST